MRKLDYLLIVFMLLFVSTTVAGRQPVLPQEFAAQVIYIDSVFGDSLNRSSLDGLLYQATEEDNRGFAECVAVYQGMYYHGYIRGMDPKGFEQLRKKAGSFGDKPECRRLKALALHYASYYLRRHDKLSTALEYGLNAYDLYRDLSSEQFPHRLDALYNLGMLYYECMDYKKANEYFLQALDNKVQLKVSEQYFNLLNAIGLCYRNFEQHDSASFYFFKALNIVRAQHNMAWDGIIGGNLGISLYMQGKYDEAIPLLQRDIQNCYHFNRDMDNAAKSLAILGDAYRIKKNYSEAKKYLEQADHIIDSAGLWNSYEYRYTIYPRIARLYAETGNMAGAYRFMDSTVVVKDKLDKERSALVLAAVENKVEAEKHHAQLAVLQHQKELQLYTRNTLIVIIALLAIIAGLVINRQSMRHGHKQEQLLTQQKQSQVELEEAERQLNLITRTLHEKNELVFRMSRELAENNEARERNDQHEILSELQQLTILTDAEWENFRQLFEKVHSGFFFRLKEKLPGLSSAEVRFMALSKLGFSNKEMAGVLGISTNAVRTIKSRLRKKLNLEEEGSIDEMVNMV